MYVFFTIEKYVDFVFSDGIKTQMKFFNFSHNLDFCFRKYQNTNETLISHAYQFIFSDRIKTQMKLSDFSHNLDLCL